MEADGIWVVLQTTQSELHRPRSRSHHEPPVNPSTDLQIFRMVAAIPCQERSGLGGHVQIPKQFPWAQSMNAVQEKIAEDWKKKEKKGRSGLLEETQRLEKLGQSLVEFAEGFGFPMEVEKAEEVAEMGEICRRMEEGLVPLQMQVSRKWAVDFTDNSSTPSSRDIPDPTGFTRASHDQDDSTLSRQKKDAEANWKSQKAWEVAQAPFKNLLMMGFMMWMAGNTVHLFSIGITFSALWQP